MSDLPNLVGDGYDFDDPDDPCADGKTIVELNRRGNTRVNLALAIKPRIPGLGSESLTVTTRTARMVRAKVLDYGFKLTFWNLTAGITHDEDSEALEALDTLITSTVNQDSWWQLRTVGF